jgi:hypothetical protein
MNNLPFKRASSPSLDSLKTIAGLEKEREIGPKEVTATLKAVYTIFEIMG